MATEKYGNVAKRNEPILLKKFVSIGEYNQRLALIKEVLKNLKATKDTENPTTGNPLRDKILGLVPFTPIRPSPKEIELIDKRIEEITFEMGRLLAKNRFIIACGGLSGVMEAICKGAKEENGLTVGILPESKEEANEFVDIPIATGLGHRRNFLVVTASDAIIAIGGRWGTLNEISYSMIFNKPLILIRGTGGSVDKIVEGYLLSNIESTCCVVDSANDAIDKVFELL